MFINRSWFRTEADDFKLNVQPLLGPSTVAIPQRILAGALYIWVDMLKDIDPLEYVTVGWEVKPEYE